MHKGKPVIYIDGLGKEREATVVDINPMHPEYMTLGYFDDLGNPQKVFDVPHFTHSSRQEMQTVKDRFGNEVQQGNPGLPTYPVNCYKERDEDHNALPADHPGFDHPFKLAEYDQQGTRIPVERPEYEKELAEHQQMVGMGSHPADEPAPPMLPSAEDLDADAAEKEMAKATNGKPRIVKGSK